MLRYAPDLEPALRGLNLRVGPLERLGIAGRTGAGKSSIIAALFRLVELSSGSVVLDGVDLATLVRDDRTDAAAGFSACAVVPRSAVSGRQR